MLMKHHEIMSALMKPIINENGKIKPMWEKYAEGDMDSEHDNRSIILKPKMFPPGTIVSISIPVCPKCGMDVEVCRGTDNCDFDWNKWAREQYE